MQIKENSTTVENSNLKNTNDKDSASFDNPESKNSNSEELETESKSYASLSKVLNNESFVVENTGINSCPTKDFSENFSGYEEDTDDNHKSSNCLQKHKKNSKRNKSSKLGMKNQEYSKNHKPTTKIIRKEKDKTNPDQGK